MNCKLGGAGYRNQEGYAMINNTVFCMDWDIDCTQCEVERITLENHLLKRIIIKLAYSDEDGGIYDACMDGIDLSNEFTVEEKALILNIMKEATTLLNTTP